MKNKNKLFLSLVLALATLVLSVSPASDLLTIATAGEITEDMELDENGFAFLLNEDGETYSVTGYAGPVITTLNIPSSFNDKPVNKIGDYAFNFSITFTKVVIPNSITHIGAGAFGYCEDVTSITIPDSVEYIGKSAFALCTKINTIVLPKNLKVIEKSTFAECYSLVRVTLPQNLERIESMAFFNTGLYTLNIPDSVYYIAGDAFEYTALQNKDRDSSGVAYIGKTLMDANPSTIPQSYIVRKGTTQICYGAFTNCRNLVSLTLPKSIRIIENGAFYNCENLSMIFYEGSLEEFYQIDFTNNEEYLRDTVVIVESSIDQKPTKAYVKKVSNVADGVQISWNPVKNTDFYAVWRRGAATSEWEILGITDQTTVVDTSAGHRQYWRYSVQPVNGAGFADFDYTGKYLKYIETPQMLGISNATNGIYTKWSSVKGASGYRVYRRGAGETTWTYLTTVKTPYYTDKSVKNKDGEYYRYTVRAVVDGVYSGYEDGIYIKRLSNPTIQNATNKSNGVTITWNPVKGTTGYYIYRKTANSNWVCIGSAGGTYNTTFTDTTAVKGTTYTYTVRAVYGKTLSYFNDGKTIKHQ